MLVVALRKGGSPCNADCPFYVEEGQVPGVRGIPLQTHCRATMETVCVDCDVWNPHEIEKLEVSEKQWEEMQQAVRKRAKKVRKPWPKDHKEIHPVGYNWKHGKGKWNSEKSNLKSKSK